MPGTPPEETHRNGLEQDLSLLPFRPAEALARLSDSKRLPGYINRGYIDLYALFKSEELKRFERHVTALETQWMLKTA